MGELVFAFSMEEDLFLGSVCPTCFCFLGDCCCSTNSLFLGLALPTLFYICLFDCFSFGPRPNKCYFMFLLLEALVRFTYTLIGMGFLEFLAIVVILIAGLLLYSE